MKTRTKMRKAAGVVAAAGSLVSMGSAGALVISYPDFSDVSGFTLNGVTGGLTPNAENVLRLTNTTGQSGSAFLSNPVVLDTDVSFSTYFQFRFTQPINSGADGLVFVVQTNAANVGGGGGGIGYAGIDNSVGVEYDNWNNGGGDANSANHTGINLNGSLTSDPIATETTHPAILGTPFDNGDVWNAWVDYNGATNTLETRLSLSDTRPSDALLSKNVDLVPVLGQQQAFIGFTSGTGAAGAHHDVLNWEFRTEFDPIDPGEPPRPPGVPDGGTTALLGLLAFGGLGFLRRFMK